MLAFTQRKLLQNIQISILLSNLVSYLDRYQPLGLRSRADLVFKVYTHYAVWNTICINI